MRHVFAKRQKKTYSRRAVDVVHEIHDARGGKALLPANGKLINVLLNYKLAPVSSVDSGKETECMEKRRGKKKGREKEKKKESKSVEERKRREKEKKKKEEEQEKKRDKKNEKDKEKEKDKYKHKDKERESAERAVRRSGRETQKQKER